MNARFPESTYYHRTAQSERARMPVLDDRSGFVFEDGTETVFRNLGCGNMTNRTDSRRTGDGTDGCRPNGPESERVRIEHPVWYVPIAEFRGVSRYLVGHRD